MRRKPIAIALCTLALFGASSPAPDAGAVAAVRSYIDALRAPDPHAAYALLTKAQQQYFGNDRNFGSDLTTTAYHVSSYSVARVVDRNPGLVEVDVDQTVSFFDVEQQATASTRLTEAYFALHSSDGWRVKELYQPWKSYAPKATGRGGPLEVEVDRIAFFDHRLQVYCTLRDVGTQALQALPLLKSTLTIGSTTVRALSQASFPLNDRGFFDGVRLYPEHQAVGWINFPLASRADADMTVTLKLAPVIVDGASGPIAITVGPMTLARW